jgi:D-3-phosphoglycerate dehydrogenase
MVDMNFLDKYPNCRYLLTATTGVSNINEELLIERKIELISLRNETRFLEEITSTSEFALGLILSVWRKIVLATKAVPLGLTRNDLSSLQIKGKKVGIVGMGRIGKRLVKYFNALECEVFFYDTEAIDMSQVQGANSVESITTLCKQANILVICASYNQHFLKSYPIIKKEHIAIMPKDSIIINVARGGLLDESAALDALETKHLYGLGLDVLADEDLHNSTQDIRRRAEVLFDKGFNLVITPHIGGMSNDAYLKCYRFIANKFVSKLDSNFS